VKKIGRKKDLHCEPSLFCGVIWFPAIPLLIDSRELFLSAVFPESAQVLSALTSRPVDQGAHCWQGKKRRKKK